MGPTVVGKSPSSLGVVPLTPHSPLKVKVPPPFSSVVLWFYLSILLVPSSEYSLHDPLSTRVSPSLTTLSVCKRLQPSLSINVRSDKVSRRLTYYNHQPYARFPLHFSRPSLLSLWQVSLLRILRPTGILVGLRWKNDFMRSEPSPSLIDLSLYLMWTHPHGREQMMDNWNLLNWKFEPKSGRLTSIISTVSFINCIMDCVLHKSTITKIKNYPRSEPFQLSDFSLSN